MLPSVHHLALKGAAQALPAGPANITPRHAALQCLHSAGAHALHVGWRQRRQAQGPDWAACAPKGRGDLRNVREQVRLDTCLGMRIDACSHGLCRHVFRHVFRHAFGHVFRRVFRPVLRHVFEHVFRDLFTPVFTGTASSRTRSGRSCCQRSRRSTERSRTSVCSDMCLDMCPGMRLDTCLHSCLRLWSDMP